MSCVTRFCVSSRFEIFDSSNDEHKVQLGLPKDVTSVRKVTQHFNPAVDKNLSRLEIFARGPECDFWTREWWMVVTIKADAKMRPEGDKNSGKSSSTTFPPSSEQQQMEILDWEARQFVFIGAVKILLLDWLLLYGKRRRSCEFWLEYKLKEPSSSTQLSEAPSPIGVQKKEAHKRKSCEAINTPHCDCIWTHCKPKLHIAVCR